MRYRQPLQNKQQNASVLLEQLQLQKQRMEDKLNRTNEDEDIDYLLQLQEMTNMKLCKHNPITPILHFIDTVAPHTFATIQPKISSGDYIKNKKMNALFNNQTFISCFVNNDNQKVNTKPILTQEEYVLYKDSLSNCHSNRCDNNYKPYSNGSLISNLYTYQDLSGVDVIVEASGGSLVSSSTIYDNYIIDPDQVLFGTQSTSTLFEYQKCKRNDTFTKEISNNEPIQIVNLTADVSGNCNNVSVALNWSVFSLQTYYNTEYDVYKNDVLYATVKMNTYTFLNLSCGEPDTFAVVGYNNCGISSASLEITPEYPPSTPTINNITYDINIDNTYDITITWTASSYPGNTEDSVSYFIYYDISDKHPVEYDVLSYTFYGLQVNTPYTFYLYAHNSVGDSCTTQKTFIPIEPFTFSYKTTDITIERSTILGKLPFITSSGNLSLIDSNIITMITDTTDATLKEVVVYIPQLDLGYTFTDDGTTTDGLCFSATQDIHDYYFNGSVMEITINWFSDIPISRGGSQFGYNDIVANEFNHPFKIEPVSNTNYPIFLTNTSLNYAFCNLVQFNSFIGFWNTTKVISAIGTFKNCTIFNNGK
jgi:hypothetical protein